MKIFVITRKKLVILSGLLILSISLAGLNTFISASKSQKEVPIYSVKREDKKIALTFNCAWGDEDILNILDILDTHNVKCTFFIVGTWAEKHPESLKEIHSRGHEIGGHSYNHGHYKKMNYQEIIADLNKCDKAIEDVINQDITLFRGGYGEYSDDVLDAAKSTNRTYIQWSVDSIDYNAKSMDEIIKRVTDKTTPGDIILMHTGTDYTAKSLNELLKTLTKDFELVKISDLIYTENFYINHSGKQFKNQVIN